MAVMTQNRKTLNFTTIHKRISEQGKIISELAPEYSMTEEAFIQEMRSGLGPKVFSALKKTSERNEKARERLKNSTVKKKQNSQKSIQPAPQEDAHEIVQENKLQDLLDKKRNIESAIQSWDVAVETSKRCCIEKEEELKKAQIILQQVQQELADTESVYQKNLRMRNEQEQKLREVDRQIIKLRQNDIYLIAPGYHGNIPQYGRFISTELIDGVENLEIQTGDVLFKDENLSDMMACGYYDVREYMRAIEFAKMCIAFITEHSQYKILIDDERISKVLKTQGIEI